jgi:hypothetical protein
MSGMTVERARQLERKMSQTAKLSGELFDEMRSDAEELRAMVYSSVSAQNAYVEQAVSEHRTFAAMGFLDRLRWLFLGAR